MLTYSCKERCQRFSDHDRACAFKESLDDLGFMTRYRKWQLLESPIDRDPFTGRMRRPPVYHLIYYCTNGECCKEFEQLDSARLWQMKLQDLGCVTDIEEVHRAQSKGSEEAL